LKSCLNSTGGLNTVNQAGRPLKGVCVQKLGQIWASCIMISLCCCMAHCLQQQHSFTQPEPLTHTLKPYVQCLWFFLRPFEELALNMYSAKDDSKHKDGLFRVRF